MGLRMEQQDHSSFHWQGVEIEYATPVKGRRGSYANSILQALEKQTVGEGKLRPFLRTSKGRSDFLINGGRTYVDHVIANDVFEACTPECRDGFQCTVYEKAMDSYARLACQSAAESAGEPVHCYKVPVAYSPDGAYTTRGLHESYLIEKRSFARMCDLLVPFLALRPLFCGVGGYINGRFVISPRQFFIKQVISKETPRDRPMIGLGKESLSDSDHVRLHVSNGEGARSDLTTFLRQSITSLVISAIERGALTSAPHLADPIRTAREISENASGNWRVEVEGGREVDAIDFLSQYYLMPIKQLLITTIPSEHDRQALQEWENVLEALKKRDFESLSKKLEWTIKLDIFENRPGDFFEVEGDTFTPAAKENLNFQFSAITDSTFDELTAELGIVPVVDEKEVRQAMAFPPEDSRGMLRVQMAGQVQLDEMDWDRVSAAGRKFVFPGLDGWNMREINRQIERIRNFRDAEPIKC